MNDHWTKSIAHENDGEVAVFGYAIQNLKDDMQNLKDDTKEIKTTVNSMNATLCALPCGVHKQRVDDMERRITQVETDTESNKSYINKAVGALVVISIIVQILVPFILSELKPAPITSMNDSPTAIVATK